MDSDRAGIDDPDLVIDRAQWLRGASWLTGGNAACMILSAASGILVARFLGPAQFGVYAVLTVVVGVAATVATFRLEIHLVTRVRGAALDVPLIQEVVRASWLMALVVVSAGAGLALAFQPAEQLVVVVAAVEVLLSPLMLGRAVLQVQSRQRALVGSALVGRLAWVTMVIGVVITRSGDPLVLILAARALSLGIEMAVVWHQAGVPLMATLSPKLLGPRRHLATLREATPLIVSGLAGTVYNRADQLILSAVRGPLETGLYAAGVRVAELLGAVAPIVDNVTLPGLVELNRRGDEAGFARAVRDATLLMTVPAGVLVALLASGGAELTILLLGSDYRAVGSLVGLLAMAEWVTLLGSVSISTALAREQRGVLVRATLAGLVVNVLVNIVFIPGFGAIAAAWACITGYGVASLYAYTVPALRVPLSGSAVAAARVLAAILVAWAVGLAPLPLTARVIAVAGAYAVVLCCVLPADARRVCRWVRQTLTARYPGLRRG